MRRRERSKPLRECRPMSMPVSVEASTNDLVRRGRVARAGSLLPTTSFMILALPCFARSSPRLEAWLLNHPRFGPGVRAWRAHGAVPRHAKIAACIGMALGFGLFWLHVRPGPLLICAVAAFMLYWAIWIVRRPEPGTP